MNMQNLMAQAQRMQREITAKKEELEGLVASVNPVRLKNNPVQLDKASLSELYERILFE